MIAGLVSTVVPVFNRPDQLRAAVASVIEQDYRPIEIVIVDDGSIDSTPSVVDELARIYSGAITAIYRANGGPGVAREAGRKLARGEYLQFLDSDDVLLPGKFGAQVRALKNCAADIAYGWTRYRDAAGVTHPRPWKGSGSARDLLFPSILVERWWDTPNPMYRRSIVERAGEILPLFVEEDWEYDCRIGALGARLAHVEEYVCEVRDHSNTRQSSIGATQKGLRDRAQAHIAMYGHATSAQLPRSSVEFQAFARRVFLLARQCGAAGLATESKQLFDVARASSTDSRAKRADFMLYEAIGSIAGWTVAGKLAGALDKLRRAPGTKQEP